MTRYDVDVVIFLPELGGGGVARVALNLMRGFVARGLRVHLVLWRHGGARLPLVPDEVKVFPLNAHGPLQEFAGLRRHLKRFRARSVLAAMPHPNLVAILAAHSVRPRPRLIATEHAQPSHMLGLSPMAKRFLLRLGVAGLYGMADGIVAVSRGVADELAGMMIFNRCRVSAIYNPVLDVHFKEDAERPADHPWLVEQSHETIVTAGSLVADKAFHILLDAFKLVLQTRDARLIVLGDGPLRGPLIQQTETLRIADRVDFPGFVANPLPYMREAKAFVLSSASEGMSLVLVEAMAMGTPVVSTDCPTGPREVLADGAYGPLVPVGDPPALARAIIQVLDDPLPRETLREGARRFEAEAIVDQYLRVLGLAPEQRLHA